ncbi:sulfotransferase [Antarctobacter sp.]|uniref:sulfotransferase n=1 Tax=Antarctobacter sp. TaxID=1872577 RepID=UPI002B274DAD|nr:sulfotransferase [Antarctobacter sp.]
MTAEFSALRRYPDLAGKTCLICVGGTKCATSWLHDYLSGFPSVAASPLKELHFFNRRFTRNAISNMDQLAIQRMVLYLSQKGDLTNHLQTQPLIRAAVDRVQMIYDDDAYFGHFARISGPDTRVLCDVTPAYSAMGAEGFDWMRRFCEVQDLRVKVLFVMRDPVERLWSHLRHMQQQTLVKDAAEVWQSALNSVPVLARGDYRAIVTALDGCFAPEDLLYQFTETLEQEPLLRRLCDFVGVPYQSAQSGARSNVTTVTTPMPEAARAAFKRALEPQYGFCHARFGTEVPVAWQG